MCGKGHGWHRVDGIGGTGVRGVHMGEAER